MRTTIQTKNAPAAVGPYSQAVRVSPWVYCAGQIPLDPESGAQVEGTIEEQTKRVLENLRAGQPTELAPAYVFLASPESSYVVGATIPVTGGMPTP